MTLEERQAIGAGRSQRFPEALKDGWGLDRQRRKWRQVFQAEAAAEVKFCKVSWGLHT